MKVILLASLVLAAHFASAQSNNEAAGSLSPASPVIAIKPKDGQESYFDFYKDLQNYALGKSCKYKMLYNKYAQIDSFPVYNKITRKEEAYPAPCYVIIGEGMVQTGIKYDYFFLMQLYRKELICLKNGKSYDPEFMRYQAYDYQNSQSTRNALALLEQYEQKTLSEKELDGLFEDAKNYFRKGDYIKSNAMFAFLATVNERYREASLNNVGLSFYNQKEYQYALVYFLKAIALYPKGYLGYLNAGACQAKLPVDLGDKNQSDYYFKKAYELAPDNPNAVFNYANTLNQYTTQGVDIQDLKENLFARAAQSKKDDPLFKLQYAKTLHQKALDGPYNEALFRRALNAYNDAIKLFPNYADNYKHKAQLLSSWSSNHEFPKNRILKDSACINLDKYKSLLKGNYDKELDRLCTHYPKLENNAVQNYTELLPGWEAISVAKGDLNKDGLDDIVLIARAADPGKIRNITRYNTPNHEKGTKNYNQSSLYILLFNPRGNNYVIKEVNDNILSVDESYYDKISEAEIKNGALKIIRQENPQTGGITRVFRLEGDQFMCIGESLTIYKDKSGNISRTYDHPQLPVEHYHISFNFNTKTMEMVKENTATHRKAITTYPVELEKYELRNAGNNEYNVYNEAKKIINSSR